MSSFFSDLIEWFKTSPSVQAGKKEALQDLSEAAQAFVASVESHAPDMVEAVTQKVTDALALAVAGNLTKK